MLAVFTFRTIDCINDECSFIGNQLRHRYYEALSLDGFEVKGTGAKDIFGLDLLALCLFILLQFTNKQI